MLRSPLHSLNEERGARFVEFSGWEMPIQFEGVIAEHKAVRTTSGTFDVSHLGRFSVSGPGSTELLRRLLCNDVTKIGPGRAQYTMALNDSGGVIDDIIVWRWGEESFWVLPNAANQERVMERFRGESPPGVEIANRNADTALVAVQGPDSSTVMEKVIGTMPGRFRTDQTTFAGEPVWMAGTGYTGERGAEVAIPTGVAPDLVGRLLDSGSTPCGLGARDTLRLEVGYPLWGQDLDELTSPLEAGLDWVIAWDHEFVGKEALQRLQKALPKHFVAFSLESRQIPRRGYPLRRGLAGGLVTSGNYSPMLECGIGMGYIDTARDRPTESLEVEIRGRWTPCRVVEPPFVKTS